MAGGQHPAQPCGQAVRAAEGCGAGGGAGECLRCSAAPFLSLSEQATKSLAAAGDLISVGALIDFLVDEYALSPQANHRKGGLIGLAAATVGLSSEHDMFLKVSAGRCPPTPAR